MPEWEVVYHNPQLGYVELEKDLEPEPGEEAKVLVRKVWYGADDFLSVNKELLANSEGQRWGDGRVAATIPMHVWATELAKPIKNGDDAYIRKWLNDYENQAYRTFKGKI